MNRKRVGLFLALAALGSGMALAGDRRRAARNPRSPNVAAGGAASLCIGGAPAPLNISIETTAFVRNSLIPGESAELSVAIETRLEGLTRLTYQLNVRDDRGALVSEGPVAATVKLSRGEKHLVQLTTPRIARDGYYQTQLTVAAKSTSGEVDERTQDMYWRVSDGRLEELVHSDWFYASAAREGKRLQLTAEAEQSVGVVPGRLTRGSK